MKVIFAGTAGVNKDETIERIAEYSRRRKGWTDDLTRTNHRAHILPLFPEEEIKKGHGSIATVLDSFNDQLRVALWHKAFKAVNRRIENAQPDNVFLSVHLSLYRHSNFFTFADWDDLRRFQPDLILTLIDDIYDVWARIRKETEQSPDRTLITLKELFAWRSAEAFYARQLSQNLFPDRAVPHYIVAVKHPLDMFYRLIFEESSPRIYACYPISRVRNDNRVIEEFNGAREKLYTEFTVFDPVTIDERILQMKAEQLGNKDKEVAIELSDRWPLKVEDCAAFSQELYPIKIPVNEVLALGTSRGRWRWQDIDNNIRWRDFALIDQAQGLLAYRPRYKKQEPSRGVTRELNYALDI